MSSQQENYRPIHHLFAQKTGNNESPIISSNTKEELKAKPENHEDNIECEDFIKTELIEHTNEEQHLEEQMGKQIVVKKDIILLEEKDVQSIYYFLVPKTENSESITINSNVKEEVNEKCGKDDCNVEQRESIKIEIIEEIYTNDETLDKVHLIDDAETEKNKIAEENVKGISENESIKNAESQSNEDKNSQKPVADNVTSSTCIVGHDLKCKAPAVSELVCHRKKMLSGEDLNDSFQCGQCAKSFTTKSDLYIDDSVRRTNSEFDTDEKQFVCNKCDKKFASSSYLKSHLRIHSDEKKYACDRCSKRFTHQNNLIEHIRIHTGEKPYVCNQCSKRFNRQSTLVNHIRTHTGEKPYVCDQCSKRFNRQSTLVNHIQTHTGEKPYVCDQCSRRFNRQRTLVDHIRIHTGEKPYICNICNKKCASSSNLVSHLRIHSEQKKYACDQCNKRFIRHDSLVSHIRTHTGEKPYVCDQCSRRFNRPSTLINHIRIHAGLKPYVCNICDKKFASSSYLKSHLRIHSNEKKYF